MKTNVIPMSAFQIYVVTDADVPGKDGASADLIKRFNDMPRGAFVFVEDDPTLLYYKGSGASYLSGNRIELVATGAGGFVPPNDNLTDLGDSTHRFRSLYLGTSILNAGNLEVDCSGATDRTLQIHNSGAGFTQEAGINAPRPPTLRIRTYNRRREMDCPGLARSSG